MLSTKKLILSAINVACLIQGIAGQISIPTKENNKNCPGVLHNDGNNTPYCCIGGRLDLSTCPGWPICTGPTREPKPLSCFTEIPFSATDYNSLVKSASSKFLQNPDATPTETAASGTESGTEKASKTPANASTRKTAAETSSEARSTNANTEGTASETASETAAASGSESASETSSGASSTATGSDSNMKTPNLVGELLGGILAMWVVL
ncbi:hypothetical protein F53441_6455 [Fusarium austroafricanum]|uniref:Hydrophobin n=1 Tax=Fusarium austroafricanum TaxID=2364996 RepID=A0A8H4KHV6_9HYPO|nr:hypothetical protein F53441_6455 [Fusarium austroafricanum]